MSDVVAALDLDNRSFRAVATTLASPLIVDATDADRCGLAFFPTLLNVRAEVVHQRIIGRGWSRIKSGSTSVPFEGLNTWGVLVLDRHARRRK